MPKILRSQLTPRSPSWYTGGLLGVLFISLILRFWGLERFNTLVFDEVYYVKFAHNYLSWTPFFDGHPPLSKYIIAIGMKIGNALPFGQDIRNAMAGGTYTTWSYRWLNAITGSLIPLVMAAVAYQLTHRRTYALITAGIAALDGLFLVESRYGLNNVYLDIFGFLGLLGILKALNHAAGLKRDLWLTIAGIGFGASFSVKWNGLWFLAGAYALWMGAWIIHWLQKRRPHVPEFLPTASDPSTPAASFIDPEEESGGYPGEARSQDKPSPLQRLIQIQWWQILLYLGVVPLVFYYLQWIPHLQLNTNTDFWKMQQEILGYHSRVGDGESVHPYCSRWFTWLFMWQPVAYYYQVQEPPAPTAANLANPYFLMPQRLIEDVHAMGSPILWWASTLGIVFVVGMILQRAIAWLRFNPRRSGSQMESAIALNGVDRWLFVFLGVSYGAQLLPWVRVTRCTFIYHYMGASMFATMAIAWLIDRGFNNRDSRWRTVAIGTLIIATLSFLFWLPVFLGIPISEVDYKLRMLFPQWICGLRCPKPS